MAESFAHKCKPDDTGHRENLNRAGRLTDAGADTGRDVKQNPQGRILRDARTLERLLPVGLRRLAGDTKMVTEFSGFPADDGPGRSCCMFFTAIQADPTPGKIRSAQRKSGACRQASEAVHRIEEILLIHVSDAAPVHRPVGAVDGIGGIA